MRRRQHRSLPRHIWTPGSTELERLRNAFIGNDNRLPPYQAADRLAESDAGLALLRRLALRGVEPKLRGLALYGFIRSTRLRSSDIEILQRIFRDESEDLHARDVAGEALYWKWAKWKPWHRRTVRLKAAFVAGLSHPEPQIRVCCAFALAHPRHADVLPKLEWMAEHDPGSLPGGNITVKGVAADAIEIITQKPYG